jgi:2-keto-4-pentenoate hydratase/2-oxohepta-3-ene-1,7-dioic acid hydratase in catechol pathway
MYFDIYTQLEYINKYMSLQEGDILMTGTPEGMGPVDEGDILEATLSHKGKLLSTINDTIKRVK